MLNREEKNKVLFEWNETCHDYPAHYCVQELFEDQVDKFPDAIALIFKEHHLTYAELNEYSNQLANYLIVLGIKPNSLVGVCFERSFEMFISIIAILKIGGTYVPLDPSHPIERLSFILKDTAMSHVLTETSFRSAFPNGKTDCICLDNLKAELSKLPKENISTNNDAKKLTYVIYTSGTTGNPKGVKVSHTNVQNYSFWFCNIFDISRSDCFDFSAPLTFDLSVTSTIVPLMYGAKIFICSEAEKAEPIRYIQAISDCSVSVIKVTPSYFKEILLMLKGNKQLESLKTIILGGEAIVPQDIKDWLEIYPEHKIVNEYGPTEATVATIAYTISKKHKYTNQNCIPIGKPAFNTQVYILDERLNPCAIGATGEIYIGGASVSQGYLNRVELTEEKFTPNPFKKEAGECIYKTGDLARYLEDGNIEYLGRVDDQIKIRGFRIEAGDIESNLLLHTGIKSTAVLAQDLENGHKKLIAYLVCEQGYVPSIFEIRSFLTARLPEYMIPHTFIMLDKMPMTNNGKLDRSALPRPDAPISEAEYIQARNDVEKELVLIWKKVLKIEKLGINDDFFVMGGDSLLAAQLITEIEINFPVGVSLDNLYKNPTISKISSIINKKIKTRKQQEDLELAKLLDQIENMNDEDVKSELSKDM